MPKYRAYLWNQVGQPWAIRKHLNFLSEIVRSRNSDMFYPLPTKAIYNETNKVYVSGLLVCTSP